VQRAVAARHDIEGGATYATRTLLSPFRDHSVTVPAALSSSIIRS
jgi:hypothetical protein